MSTLAVSRLAPVSQSHTSVQLPDQESEKNAAVDAPQKIGTRPACSSSTGLNNVNLPGGPQCL